MGIVVNVIIVEDNPADASVLSNMLARYSAENGVQFRTAVYGDAYAFLESYRADADVIFMDIELPGMNGMEAAKRLRETDTSVSLMFVTNMAQFAVNGYEVDALDFIVKPIIWEQFRLKLGRALSRTGLAGDVVLPVKTADGFVSVPASRLKYVEVMGHRLVYHTTDGNVESSGSLYKIEQMLSKARFVRCNSCYLVNPRYVQSINKLTTVVGGDELKISYARRKEYRMAVAEYLGGLSDMYEFTALYLYKAVFMAELLVAEFLMCIGMKRRPLFALRFALCCVLCIGIAFALPVLAYNALYCSAAFLVMFAATLPAIKWCYADNMTSVVFRAMAAYTVQHIAYQAFAFIMFFVGLMFGGNNFAGGVYGDGSASELFPIIVYGVSGDILSSSPMMYAFLSLFAYSAYFIVYIITYTLSYRFVSPLLKNSDKFELRNSSLLIFVGCFVLFNVVISSVVTYYSEGHNDILYVPLLSLYNIACCIFTMFLMFEVIFRKQYERDYVTAARMLKQSEERYALTKENIELINMKCHDLKHQIRLIRSSPAADSAALGEIEDLIQVYDSAIRTGNEALDIILAEKSLYCNRHGIRLYCIADGALLSFIADSDLYALFGNLLDNAIEAVEELEGDRRFINLSIKKINGFATLSMSNCHSRPLDFRDGLPATTKQDKSVHGYGMKSVRLICKKYDAELILNDDNGVFTVKIVFMQ